MRSFKTEGFVIKRNNYNEADRIITIFSKRNGKIKVKATGVRRITSRRSSHIELLNYSVFGLYQGRNIPVLTEVESIDSFSDIKKDLKKIMAAFHICELVDGLCAENQENLEIFNLFENTLKKISIEEKLAQPVYEFELGLLSLLGFHTPMPNGRQAQVARVDTKQVIESILERKLKTRDILPQFNF